MVGIPRSKACLTCLSRRVKVTYDTYFSIFNIYSQIQCDEERPECMRCRRGNRKCGGYNRPAKFVNSAPESVKKSKPGGSQRSTSHFRTSQNENSSIISFSSPGSDSTNSIPNSPAAFSWATIMQGSPRANLISPQAELAQTVSVFLAAFNPSTQNPNGSESLKLFTPWLRFIPEYVGKSSALDTALACLSLHSIGSFSRNNAILHDSCRYYGKALHNLRRNLVGRESALAPETLCATMILTIYEVSAF